MRNICIVIVCFFNTILLYGQNATKEYVDNWVVNNYREIKVDSTSAYIFNGYMIGDNEVDGMLARFTINEILIEVVDPSQSAIFCNPISCVIIISTKKKMRRKKYTRKK